MYDYDCGTYLHILYFKESDELHKPVLVAILLDVGYYDNN